MKKLSRNATLIFLAVTIVWVIFLFTDTFIWFDLKLFDSIIRHSPQPLYDTNIVVIEYDDKTADNLSSPLTTSDLAGFLECVKEMAPRTIALDLFSLRSELIADDPDHILDSLLARNSNVIVGSAFVVPERAETYRPVSQNFINDQAYIPFSYPRDSHDSRYYFYVEHVLKSTPDVTASAHSIGHLNLINDIDGICRKIPGFISCGIRSLLPSFGLQAALNYLDVPREKVSLLHGSITEKNSKTGVLPLDKFGRLTIQYNNNPCAFQEMPMIDFLAAYKDSAKIHDLKNILKNKLVFIGNVSLKSGRFLATPYRPYYPSILIHATTASNLINSSFIISHNKFVEVFLIVFLGIFILLSMIFLEKIKYTFVVLLYIPLLMIIDIALLIQYGSHIPLFAVMCYIFSLFFLLVLYRYIDYKNSLVTRLEKLQKEILVNERLAAIGQVSAQTAHAIRNPLGVITLYTSHLRRNDQTDQSRAGFLDVIDKEVNKLNLFLTSLLDFTKPIRLKPVKIVLRRLLEDVEKCIAQYIRNKSITFDISAVPSYISLMADPDYLRDVFINLCRNSIDAIPDNGVISVHASDITDNVTIIFSDTGSGMKEEDLNKAFNLFFTTKKNGNGLGLPMVKNIIEAHHGSITINSKEGKGTHITIQFPHTGE